MSCDVNISFSRALLKGVIKEVKKAGIKNHQEAWVWKFSPNQFEFHFVSYYDGCVSASNAYEARAKGWEGYLKRTK